MNSNGGGLSYTHPGMYGSFLVVEAVRQLRGEGGDRQVKSKKDPNQTAKTTLVNGTGGSPLLYRDRHPGGGLGDEEQGTRNNECHAERSEATRLPGRASSLLLRVTRVQLPIMAWLQWSPKEIQAIILVGLRVRPVAASGSNSVVECLPSKQGVAGSNPVSRSSLLSNGTRRPTH